MQKKYYFCYIKLYIEIKIKMINNYLYLFIIILFVKNNHTFFDNNKRIINDFSLKENILFYSFLALPTMNKYLGKDFDGEGGIKKTFEEELKQIWNIKDLVKYSFIGENKLDHIKKLFDNTFIRGILVWLLMPRMFHYSEHFHKITANNLNRTSTKNIFLTKNLRLKKQKEINALIEKNNTELSDILNQLKNKNPQIEYRFNKKINEPIDSFISKKEVYKNAIKIKKALEIKEHILNHQELEDYINTLDVDDSFKDIDFITKNRGFFKNLPEIKLIKKQGSIFFDEPLEKTLQTIESTLLDKEHIMRDQDTTPENSLKAYDYYLNHTIKKTYPFPYSKYVIRNNENSWWSSLFDTVNHVTKLN